MPIITNDEVSIQLRIYRSIGRFRRKFLNRFISVADKVIKYVIEINNQKLNKIIFSITTKIILFVKKYLQFIELDVFLISGKTEIDNNQFNLVFFGEKSSSRFFLNSIFNQNQITEEKLGRISPSDIENFINQELRDVDLIVVERLSNDKRFPSTGEWICTPKSVHMIYRRNSDESFETFEKRDKNYNRTNFSKVRKEGFFPVLSKTNEDVEFFYYNMHLPLVKRRHGDNAEIIPLSHYQKLMSSGFVLFSCLPNGEKVAGAIIATCGKTLYGLIFGVLNADDKLYKIGALASIYIFTLEYAFQHNYIRINMGGVLPLMKDGVYIHKKRWGLQPEINPWPTNEWLIWVPNESEEGFNWLEKNQFLPQFIKIHGKKIENIYSQSP